VLGSPSSVPVSIIDNGSGLAFSSPIYVGTETDGGITLGVSRVGTNDITKVSYATFGGTATNGAQYIGVTNQLTFNRGEFFKAVFINFIRDTNVTGDLFFNVNLFGASNVLNPSTPVQIFTNNPAIVTIKDADPGVLFTNANFGVLKSGTNVLITVLRSNVNTGTVTVGYGTADGTAAAGADYTRTSGLLTFSNGIGQQSFSIPIRNNLQALDNRTFTVFLTNASPGMQLLSPSIATITITNDTAGIAFSSSGYSIPEGSAATINVLRSGYTNSTVSVNFSTANGTATSLNYAPTNGMLVFTNGETSKSFVVFTKTDGIVTNNHTVLLGLGNLSSNAAPQNPNQATLTILESEGTLIVPAGAALISESGPVNGAIDPGERVGVLLALRNAAGSNVSDVQATLLATNGVGSPSPSGLVDYGPLAGGAPSVSRPFTFTANATNGQVVSATLRLLYGGITNYAVFNFQVGQVTNSFTNGATIIINAAGNATPYPSTNVVSGLGNLVTHTSVTLTNLYHTHPSDIDMILVAPTGTNTYLMAKAGGAGVLNPAVTVTFDDSAASGMPQGPITNGNYRPTSYALVAPNFPPPAPFSTAPGFYRTNLTTFSGINPNGVWSLYVIDDSQGSAGVITNGWVLNLTTAEIPSASDLAVGLAASANPVVVTSNLTYTLYVTNYGPSTASNIVVTDVFPPSAVYVGSTPSTGSAAINGSGQLVWTFSGLTNTGVASNQVVIQPSVVGNITNTVSVAAATVDPNPDDDTTSLVTSVSDFTADLTLTVSGLPNPVLLGGNITYTLTVTNLGPATATGVTINDTLPPGSQFVSASPSGYVVAGNSVTFTNLGALGAGSQLSVNITAQPLVTGTVTDQAFCDNNVTDPLKANNFMSIKTIVEALGFHYSGGNLVLTWPTDLGSYTIFSTTDLAPPVVWTPVTTPPIQSAGGTNSLTLPVTGAKMFFRLQSQVP
jgi:uncharacterized repeat protein (TIGR01451 family)